MSGLPNKLISHVKRYGMARTARKIGYELVACSGIVKDIDARRDDLSAILDRQFDGTVRYGALKGFRFVADSWWSKIDRAAMLLGIYEQEILAEIAAQAGRYDCFIDIGAADGYYDVGCVSQGLFKRSHCFEISEIGQSVIAQTAALNGVANRVAIHGMADAGVLSRLPGADLASAVVLIDIEGAEFDFVTAEVLDLLKSSVILIELHEWNMPDPAKALAELENRVRAHFEVETLTMGARNPAAFPELRNMSDADRWLICMEGRATLQTWWKLTPRA